MTELLYPKHEVVFENVYATLLYYPDHKLIHHKFHRPLQGQALHDVLNAGADLLAERKATKWLSDDRNNAQLTSEDADWANREWSPRAVRAGWKYWALVVPEELVARFSMRRPVDRAYEEGLRIAAFVDTQEAKDWLESLEPAALPG